MAGAALVPARRKIIAAFAKNLKSRFRYRGERRTLGAIIYAQARHLAEAFTSARKAYRPFLYNH
jgi:hypothetical protein